MQIECRLGFASRFPSIACWCLTRQPGHRPWGRLMGTCRTSPVRLSGPQTTSRRSWIDLLRLIHRLCWDRPIRCRWKPRVFPAFQFQRPVEVTFAEDDSNRLFVAEQRGVIYVFANRDDVEEKQVFLDIQDVVSRDGNEEGLLGLAFHPGYKTNGEFYVDYSTRPSISVVSRFRVSDDEINRADRGSEEVVMRIDQPYANHHGGSTRFGPDGYREHQENQVAMLDRLGVFNKPPDESPDKLENFPVWGFGNFDRSEPGGVDRSQGDHSGGAASAHNPPDQNPLTSPAGARPCMAGSQLCGLSSPGRDRTPQSGPAVSC